MSFKPTTIERAFTLARTGDYSSTSEIKAQLRTEGYAINQIEGPTLVKQIRDLCVAAKAGRDA